MAKGRGADSSRTVIEAASTNPPPRFEPPRRIPTIRSSVPVAISNVIERPSDQAPNMLTERVKRIQRPTEGVQGQHDSTTLEGDSNFLQQNTPPPQGMAYICLHFTMVNMNYIVKIIFVLALL